MPTTRAHSATGEVQNPESINLHPRHFSCIRITGQHISSCSHLRSMTKGSYTRRPHSDPTRATAAPAAVMPPSPGRAPPAASAQAYSRSPSQSSQPSSVLCTASSAYGSGTSFSAGQPGPSAVPGGPPSFLPSTSALSNDTRPNHLSFNLQLRNELDVLDVELSDALAVASAPTPTTAPQAQRRAKK